MIKRRGRLSRGGLRTYNIIYYSTPKGKYSLVLKVYKKIHISRVIEGHTNMYYV